MTWTYEYDGGDNETTIYWDDDKQATINGEIAHWRNGYPASDEARETVAEAIQNAGNPERIRIQFGFNYGFEEQK